MERLQLQEVARKVLGNTSFISLLPSKANKPTLRGSISRNQNDVFTETNISPCAFVLCGLICTSNVIPNSKTLIEFNDNQQGLFTNVWVSDSRCIMARSWCTVSLRRKQGVIDDRMMHAIIHVY